jgi:hypothetical protein
MGRRFDRIALGLFLTAMTLAWTIFESSAAEAVAIPAEIETAEPLAASELESIYSGRSWIWDSGAGYFAASPRNFSAYVGEGETGSIAKGRWTISNRGRLCMVASWVSSGSSVDKRTCFSHRRIGEVIYQRREPSGDWYVLRNSPGSDSDEINKIQKGDAVTPNYQAIAQAIE